MFKKLINEKYYCGLDIGEQRIKVGIIYAKDPTQRELLGVYESDTHGFQNGAVSDLGELSECIHHAAQQLSNKTGIKLKQVYLGIDGNLIDARETTTAIPLIDKGSKVIAHRDVRRLNKQAHLLGIKMEEEILHNLPQRYLIDDNSSALNPLGLYGRKLGVSSLLIVANANRIRNIIKAVNQAGLDVVNVYFGSYVSADIVLTNQEKNEGCVLVDVGSTVTSVLIFKEGLLKFVEKISCGGDHFTKRIAEELNLPFKLAEEIKKTYAVAISSEHHPQEEILVKRESAYIPIRREAIYNSIEPKIKHFVESLRIIIKGSGYTDQVNRGMVMVGGGALLPGLMERITDATNMEVRLGTINDVTQKNLNSAAIYSTVVGLAQGDYGKFNVPLTSNGRGPWVRKVTEKMRELYQEYF